MSRKKRLTSRWSLQLRETFYRIAASGVVPARLVLPSVPDPATLPGRTGPLKLEIVTHCWNYAHLLAYQLSSLAAFPPTRCQVTMTVFFSPEDRGTLQLLEHYEAMQVSGVRWNWQPLEPPELFRRAIGRNRAALATGADWIWYTDCDVFFMQGCLDGLSDALQGRRELLVYPREERTTPLLLEGDPLLDPPDGTLSTSLDTTRFDIQSIHRAKGAWQITHGDVARKVGYCGVPFYQAPRTHWIKSYEDRTYRWLLRTEGAPIDVPGIFRIRHATKGRYGHNSRATAAMRGNLRRLTSWLREMRRHVRAGENNGNGSGDR